MKGGNIRAIVVRHLFVFSALLVLLGWVTGLLASENEQPEESLSGVQGIGVMVMETNSDAQKNGLKRDQIMTNIKEKLRKADIKVLTDREMGKPGFPYFYVDVNVEKDKDPKLYKYGIKTDLYTQYIINPEDAKENMGFAMFDSVKVWSNEASGTAPAGDLKNNVQKHMDDAVDKFIHAYKAANPKEGSTP